MKQTIPIILIAVMFVVGVFSGFAFANFEAQKKIANLEQQILYLNDTNQELQTKISVLKNQIENLTETNLQLQQENSELNETITTLKNEIYSLQSQIDQLKSENKQLKTSLGITKEGAYVTVTEKNAYKQYDYLIITGKLKNTGTKTAYWVQVYANLYDQNKKFIDRDWTYADKTNLNPGETTTFKIMYYMGDRNIEYYDLTVQWSEVK